MFRSLNIHNNHVKSVTIPSVNTVTIMLKPVTVPMYLFLLPRFSLSKEKPISPSVFIVVSEMVTVIHGLLSALSGFFQLHLGMSEWH